MHPLTLIGAHWPELLQGMATTLALTGIALLISGLIAPGLALVRIRAGVLTQAPLRLYVSFFRGTPLIAQLFLIYYGSGQFRQELQAVGLWGFFREPWNCTLLAFVLNTTAYQIEILRGGLMGVPVGQIEAARAIGMSPAQQLRRVFFPNAYRIAWPALGNEMILMLKSSAIASVVTIFDLMGHTRNIFAETFDFSIYLWAAVIYLAITSVFVFVWNRTERWLSPHVYARIAPSGPTVRKHPA
jgi:polar amino acid transport system permease protein